MNKNEAKELEKIDEFIDDKTKNLHELNDSYEFFLRRLNTFVSDYSKKVSTLAESMNKQIDEMHKMIDSFKTIYEDSIKEIDNKNKEILEKNNDYNGEYAKSIIEELNRKLTSEIDKLKNSSNKMLDNYSLEYQKSCDNIKKINKRLNKLKERNYR